MNLNLEGKAEPQEGLKGYMPWKSADYAAYSVVHHTGK